MQHTGWFMLSTQKTLVGKASRRFCEFDQGSVEKRFLDTWVPIAGIWVFKGEMRGRGGRADGREERKRKILGE